MAGWIKLHRQIVENKMWNDKPFSKGQAWLDILLNTSYEKSSFWVRGILVEVNPGQCSMSTHTMAERWGWSRTKVRAFLSYLETRLQIEPQKTNVTTLITITNWDKYQEKEPQKEPQKNHRKTTEKPIKEVKEVKEDNIPPKIEDVTAYCSERNRGVDPHKWYDFYASKGWMVGKNKMKDWKAAVRI